VGVSQTAALNRGRHLYSAGRPSRWAFAHISSLSLCLLATLRNNFQTDLHEIFRAGWQWATEQTVKFWWRSGSQIRIRIRIQICIVPLVRRALAKVCSVPVLLVYLSYLLYNLGGRTPILVRFRTVIQFDCMSWLSAKSRRGLQYTKLCFVLRDPLAPTSHLTEILCYSFVVFVEEKTVFASKQFSFVIDRNCTTFVLREV